MSNHHVHPFFRLTPSPGAPQTVTTPAVDDVRSSIVGIRAGLAQLVNEANVFLNELERDVTAEPNGRAAARLKMLAMFVDAMSSRMDAEPARSDADKLDSSRKCACGHWEYEHYAPDEMRDARCDANASCPCLAFAPVTTPVDEPADELDDEGDIPPRPCKCGHWDVMHEANLNAPLGACVSGLVPDGSGGDAPCPCKAFEAMFLYPEVTP